MRHTQISLSGILRHFRPPSQHLLLNTHDTNMEFLQLNGPLLDIFLFFSKSKIFHSHPCIRYMLSKILAILLIGFKRKMSQQSCHPQLKNNVYSVASHHPIFKSMVKVNLYQRKLQMTPKKKIKSSHLSSVITTKARKVCLTWSWALSITNDSIKHGIMQTMP